MSEGMEGRDGEERCKEGMEKRKRMKVREGRKEACASPN